MSRWIFRFVICGLLVSTACSGDTPSTSPGPDDGERATVSFISPEEGSTISASKLKVEVEVTGLEIVNKIGEENVEGEGHLVFYASNGFSDTYEVPTTQGQPANSGGTGYIGAAVDKTTYDWSVWNLKPGKQKLAVQLVNNDNTPLPTPAVAEITITVKKGKEPAKTPEPGADPNQPAVPGGPQGDPLQTPA